MVAEVQPVTRMRKSSTARGRRWSCHSSMCGRKPCGVTAVSSDPISACARPGSMWDSAIAWKALSHDHWNGYVSGDGQVNRNSWPAPAE